jgi:hypothetical protein
MDERINTPVEGNEPGEARSSEQQDLENATLDPRAQVEQSGDIQQAEDVQESFTRVVENAEEQVGRQPQAAEGPFEQVSTSGDDGGEQATPINLPDVQAVAAVSQPIPSEAQEVGATPQPIPRPEDDSYIASLPDVRGDLDQVSVTGTDSPGGEEATPIPLPGQRGTASQAALEEGAQISTATPPRGRVAMDDKPPPPPDLGIGQAPEGVVMDDSEAFPDAPPPDTGPEVAGEGTSTDDTALPDDGTDEAGEVEEVWNPPDVYLYVGQDGAMTVVDSDGNPYGNPPIVKTHDGQNYYAFYYGHEDKTFDIPYYSGTLQEGWSLHIADDGTLTVIDEKGIPVQNPPIVATHDGQNYYAYYPGDLTKTVDLTNYCPPWDKVVVGTGEMGEKTYSFEKPEWYLYTDQDGKQTVVDGDGNPVPNPPCIGTHDGKSYYAYYPGSGGVPRPIYYDTTMHIEQPTLDLRVWAPPFNKATVVGGAEGEERLLIEEPSWFVHVDQDGKLSVVDEKGVPIKNPPVIATHDGINYYAYYPGGGDEPSSLLVGDYYVENMPTIALPLFKGSLQEDWFALTGKDGKVTVVDRDGNPVSCPPLTNTHDGQNYYAYYPGDDTKTVDLKPYTAPLQGRYLLTGQDGTMTVVDSSGKPLAAQPLIGTHDGKNYYAYYPGDPTQYALTHYLPPSSKPKSGSSS